MRKYSVKLDTFEGPLDLLLHLINQYEIDIYDIPVAKITEQYLRYVHTMKELQLDIASEYLVMAATLLAMKSKMLLPKKESELLEEEFEEGFEVDPREELVLRLIEYKKFKEAATVLKEKEHERSLVFSKTPSSLDFLNEEEGEREVKVDVNLYDMLHAFQKMLKRKKDERPLQTRIVKQEISIEQKMAEIIHDLTVWKGKRNFTELFDENANKGNIVVTFLAILELMKTKQIYVEQDRHFANIYIQKIDEVE